MAVVDFWNLVVTFVCGGLSVSLLIAWRRYRKKWMDRGVNLTLALAVVSFVVALVRH